MTTRIACPDQGTADQLAAGIDEAGFDAAVIVEHDGPGQLDEAVYAVYTPALPELLAERLPPGATVETY